MTWSIIARDEDTGRIGIAVAARAFAVGARVPHHQGRRRRGRDAGVDQSVLRPARPGAAGRRRDGRGCRAHADDGRRGPRSPPAAHDGPPRPVRRAHGQGVRRLVRASGARDVLGGGQHAGRARRARRDGASLRRRQGHAVRAAAARGHAGRRGGRRRQARQAVRGTAHPRQRGVSAYRPARRRPCRSAAELARLEAVPRERWVHFRRYSPARANPSGLLDRDALEDAIARSIAEGYE